MKFTVSTFLLLLTLALGGCRDWFPPVDPNDPKDPKDPRDTVPAYDSTDAYLYARQWCLVAIESPNGVDVMNPALPRYMYIDGRGKISGLGGYNQFQADFKKAGGAITISNFGATKMVGDAEENLFFDVLRRAQRYEGDLYGLRMVADRGETLHFEPCYDSVVIDDPKSVALGQEFRLRSGLSASVENQNLVVTFAGVMDDSRCPLGVSCVWEGDARLGVSLSDGFTVIYGELHTNPKEGPQTLEYNGYVLHLVSLEPIPLQNQQIDPADYVAVLRVTKL